MRTPQYKKLDVDGVRKAIPADTAETKVTHKTAELICKNQEQKDNFLCFIVFTSVIQ